MRIGLPNQYRDIQKKEAAISVLKIFLEKITGIRATDLDVSNIDEIKGSMKFKKLLINLITNEIIDLEIEAENLAEGDEL